MYDNKIVGSEYLFQSFLIKLFNKLGYKIETEVQKKDTISKFSNRRADIIAIKEEKIYCIEIKYSRISKKAIEKVYNFISGTDMIPVIVTAFEIKKKERENYKKNIQN
jgi:archaeal holliday junction resolvase (hjc)